MAAYGRVYDSRHLQADYQEPGSAPEPYARQSRMGYLYLFLLRNLICRQIRRLQRASIVVQNKIFCDGQIWRMNFRRKCRCRRAWNWDGWATQDEMSRHGGYVSADEICAKSPEMTSSAKGQSRRVINTRRRDARGRESGSRDLLLRLLSITDE